MLFWDLPNAQRVHVEDPLLALYFPFSQPAQASEPEPELLPAEPVVGVVCEPSVLTKYSRFHNLHAFSHCVQYVAFPSLKVPASQREQVVAVAFSPV